MANQQGNVQCIQGAYGEPAFEELDEIFYVVKPNTGIPLLVRFFGPQATALFEKPH